MGYPRIYKLDGDCSAGLSEKSREAINSASDTLNDVTAKRAADHGFGFGDVRPTFTGHEICTGDAWLHSVTLPVDESYHPTAAGQSGGYLPVMKANSPDRVDPKHGGRRFPPEATARCVGPQSEASLLPGGRRALHVPRPARRPPTRPPGRRPGPVPGRRRATRCVLARETATSGRQSRSAVAPAPPRPSSGRLTPQPGALFAIRPRGVQLGCGARHFSRRRRPRVSDTASATRPPNPQAHAAAASSRSPRPHPCASRSVMTAPVRGGEPHGVLPGSQGVRLGPGGRAPGFRVGEDTAGS